MVPVESEPETCASDIGNHKFSGPNNVTLEYHNAVQRSYTDYYNTVNIRKGYSVTDKADGERNLLVIGEEGECYLFNRKNVVKATGKKIDAPRTILDGEYISASNVKALAKLPSKEMLIGQFVGGLQSIISRFVMSLSSPTRGLVYTLEQIKNNKNN